MPCRKNGCFILLGVFLVQMGVFGVNNNFGLIFHVLMKDFSGDASQIAWIGSFGMGMTFLVSPIAHLIYRRWGFNRLIGLSISLCITSLAASSFVRHVELFSLTFSILWGTGAGFANHASMVLVQTYFTENISIANGIASSGTGFGALVLGQLMNWLLNNYGFRWAFRACTFIPLLFTFLLYSYKLSKEDKSKSTDANHNSNMEPVIPIQNPMLLPDNKETFTSKETKLKAFNFGELVDRELWSNMKYVVFVIGISIFLFGAPIPFVFLISHAINAQITPTDAQFLISILSIVSTSSKVLSGFLMDFQNKITRTSLLIFSIFCMSLSNLIAAMATQYWQFCVFSVIFGMFEGCFIGQLVPAVVDCLPSKEKCGVAIGNLYAMISLPIMLGSVFAGSLVKDNSFAIPFYVATLVTFLGAFIACMSKCVGMGTVNNTNKYFDDEVPLKTEQNNNDTATLYITSV